MPTIFTFWLRLQILSTPCIVLDYVIKILYLWCYTTSATSFISYGFLTPVHSSYLLDGWSLFESLVHYTFSFHSIVCVNFIFDNLVKLLQSPFSNSSIMYFFSFLMSLCSLHEHLTFILLRLTRRTLWLACDMITTFTMFVIRTDVVFAYYNCGLCTDSDLKKIAKGSGLYTESVLTSNQNWSTI